MSAWKALVAGNTRLDSTLIWGYLVPSTALSLLIVYLDSSHTTLSTNKLQFYFAIYFVGAIFVRYFVGFLIIRNVRRRQKYGTLGWISLVIVFVGMLGLPIPGILFSHREMYTVMTIIKSTQGDEAALIYLEKQLDAMMLERLENEIQQLRATLPLYVDDQAILSEIKIDNTSLLYYILSVSSDQKNYAQRLKDKMVETNCDQFLAFFRDYPIHEIQWRIRFAETDAVFLITSRDCISQTRD